MRHDGVEYEDATMDLDDFYSRIDQMVDDLPTSSQPSQLTRLRRFSENAAQAGDDVLGVFISSRMSGTYEGAVRAARAVRSGTPPFPACSSTPRPTATMRRLASSMPSKRARRGLICSLAQTRSWKAC